MKILQVFPLLPFPPDDGGRIGFFNAIKHLSKRNEISVISLIDENDKESDVEELKKFCVSLRTFRRQPSWDSLKLLRGVVSSPPGTAAKYWYPLAGDLIRETVQQWRPDIVEFHHLNTAVYRCFAERVPTVLREHNVEFKVWERFAKLTTAWPERMYANWCAPRVRRYEAIAATEFDHCVVVSPADKEHLRAIAPNARIDVIPSGVDTEYFFPSPDTVVEPLSLTLTGSFAWRPKQQSLFSLLSEVFPRIRDKVPGAKFYIVGKGIPDELKRLADRTPGVSLVGPVGDVRPYVWRSSVLINYLESGGGIALKVLEAMAMRKPVLSNSLGCEGIEVENGRDVFLADGPEEFATAAARLLGDCETRESLAELGYHKVLERYAWDVITPRLERLYESVVKQHLVPKVDSRATKDSEKMVAIDPGN